MKSEREETITLLTPLRRTWVDGLGAYETARFDVENADFFSVLSLYSRSKAVAQLNWISGRHLEYKERPHDAVAGHCC